MRNEQPDLGGIAVRVLGPYLEEQGFTPTVTDRARVEFTKSGLVLRISYYAEDGSPRGLNVGLGAVYADGSTDTVGLWALVPEHGVDRAFETARFANEVELASLLENLRDGALRDWAAAYWRDPDLLVAALHRAAVGRELEHLMAVERKHLDEARRAFAVGNFQAAVDRYVMVADGLSTVDQQRLKIARRKLASGG